VKRIVCACASVSTVFLSLCGIYEYDSDVDAAAFDGDERVAQGGIVPREPRSLAQAPPSLGVVPSACVLVSPLYININRL